MLIRTWNVFHGNTSPPRRRAFPAHAVRLAELRDTYARALDEADAEQYVREFNDAVVDRWRELALTIEES